MTDLAATVNEQHAKLSTAQAIEPREFGPIDRQRVLALIGLNVKDPKAHAVVAVAERYGLDPVLGHIEIIPRSARPYITRDGYLHIAHRSGEFDGMDVVEGPYRDGAEWACKVSVFRKDMAHAFTYPGRASVTLDNGPEMAIARAERRALKRAFAVTLPRVFGEADDGAPEAPADSGYRGIGSVLAQPDAKTQNWPETAPSATQADEQPAPVQPGGPADTAPDSEPTQPISNGQRRAIFALFRELGVPDDERDRRLDIFQTITGRRVESTNDLTYDEAGSVITALGRLQDEGKSNNGAMEGTTPDSESQ